MSSSTICEANLRAYLLAFDGNKRDFSSVENLFDVLFHEDFAFTFKDGSTPNPNTIINEKYANINYGKTIDREEVKTYHAKLLSGGTKIQLIHYRKIGLGCIDVEMKIINKEEGMERLIREVYSIQSNKFIRCIRVNDGLFSVIKAKYFIDYICNPWYENQDQNEAKCITNKQTDAALALCTY